MTFPFHLDLFEIVRRLVPIALVAAVSQAYVVPLLSEWRYGRAGFERRYQGRERLTAVLALGFGLALPVMYVLSLPSLRERHEALTRFEALAPHQIVSVTIERNSGRRLLEGHEKIRTWLVWKAFLEPVGRPLWGLGDPQASARLLLEGREESFEVRFWPGQGRGRDSAVTEVWYGGKPMGRYYTGIADPDAGEPVEP